METTIDHVPYACSDLEEMARTFERLGLTPEYGGVHDNGVTHMSILGFEDGSYLELISERERGEHDFWPEHIRGDAGPAAWCVRVPDIVATCRRMLESGLAVQGPVYGSRERDDGRLVEWDVATFGTHAKRLVHPFAIADRTPHSLRSSPTPSVAGGPLTGIGQVVLGVHSLDASVGLFRESYRFPGPVREDVPGFGEVASFPGRPLALASGTSADWLADRLDRFRECPCSCLLATPDLDAAMDEFPLSDPTVWPDGRVAFFEGEDLGYRLGVVERD